MGQIADLVRWAQVVSYTSATSGRSHRSRILSPPGGSRRNHLPLGDAHQGNNIDHRNQEVHYNGYDRDAHQRRRAHEPNRGHNKEVNQRADHDLHHNLLP